MRFKGRRGLVINHQWYSVGKACTCRAYVLAIAAWDTAALQAGRKGACDRVAGR